MRGGGSGARGDWWEAPPISDAMVEWDGGMGLEEIPPAHEAGAGKRKKEFGVGERKKEFGV